MDNRPHSIMEQAQCWVVEIRDPGFFSDYARQAEFRDWLNRSAQHTNAFARSNRTFQRLSCLRALPGLDLEDRLQWYRHARRRSFRDRWRPWSSAAALLFLLMLLPLVPQEIRAAPKFYVTRLGERSTVVLGDGSTLRLNSGTRVLVQPSGEFWEVDLLEGETYFSLLSSEHKSVRIFALGAMITGSASDFDVSHTDGKMGILDVVGQIRGFGCIRPPTFRLRPREFCKLGARCGVQFGCMRAK